MVSSILSVISSDLSSVLPSVGTGVPTSLPNVPSIISSLVSSAASQLSSGVPVPSGSVTVPLPTSLPLSSMISSIEASVSSALSTLVPSATSGVVPSSGISSGTGSNPSATSSGISSNPTAIPTSESTGIPSSETVSGSSAGSSALSTGLPLTSGTTNSTESELPVSTPRETPTATPTLEPTSSPIEIPFVPPTTKPKVPSIAPTGTDSATTYIVGTSIIQEPSTAPSPQPTTPGIPSDLPKMIAPPGGMPTVNKEEMFLGQIGWKWPLNWPFVCANDGGNQIFTYLPMAIGDALNITYDQVQMQGLKPFDTTEYSGFITTMALFWIPKDLNSTLAAQLRNPPDPFWHNKNQTVNDMTNLINTAFPLPAGKMPGDNEPNVPGGPASTASGGPQDGGALGGDMGASKPVNPASAGIAMGAIVGAVAYGSAMFFVARRYRNKKMSHQRSSSVPSTSRFTYGSIQGGVPWMSGGRGPGRSTPGIPGSRGSRGSSSSNGRSVRTQQISAPVMAENSLGWN
ncbi:hypothetical protein EJ04DRAFT_436901 [Polyplosphaeria fusca]|uniref:Uncharacterized protein n=1 Tax=Polyplosphaeria fusca TaxID=682080 RepID=A0A9P4R0I3_9PLEO|nr:hypothetical protein EJ04DRAFT_436901 [Polyplosphaeria fusca]